MDDYDAKQAHEECYEGNPGARVLRGGSFRDSPAGCRCAPRDYANPSNSVSYHGFRVAAGAAR